MFVFNFEVDFFYIFNVLLILNFLTHITGSDCLRVPVSDVRVCTVFVDPVLAK